MDALPQDEGQRHHERPELPSSDGAAAEPEAEPATFGDQPPRPSDHQLSHPMAEFVDNPFLQDSLWLDPLAERKKQVAITRMPPIGQSSKQSIAYVIPRKATELPKEGEYSAATI